MKLFFNAQKITRSQKNVRRKKNLWFYIFPRFRLMGCLLVSRFFFLLTVSLPLPLERLFIVLWWNSYKGTFVVTYSSLFEFHSSETVPLGSGLKQVVAALFAVASLAGGEVLKLHRFLAELAVHVTHRLQFQTYNTKCHTFLSQRNRQ